MTAVLDPQDPRCPDCDGPISATATYCMHCYTNFETTPARDSTRSASADTGRTTTATDTETAAAGGLLSPDGLLDDSLTVTVGVVAGIVVGILTLVTTFLLTGNLWSLVVAVVVWVGVTGFLARRRTVHRAVRGGCYAVAFGLVALPTIAFSQFMTGGDFAGRVFLFVLGEVFLGLAALVLVALGYVIGRKSRHSAA